MAKQKKHVSVFKSVSQKPAEKVEQSNLNTAGDGEHDESVAAADTKKTVIEHILSLGGNKKDLDLIDVEDASDVEDLEIFDDDTEPIKRDDILKLIDDLGIRKERPAFAKEEKEIKLVSSEYVTDRDDSQPSTSKDKKKSKNKFKVQDEEISSTTLPEAATDVNDDEAPKASEATDLSTLLSYINKGYKRRDYLLVKPGRWLAQLESKDNPVHTGCPHKRIVEIEEFAKQILDDDTLTANSNKSGADHSNREWMKKMVSSGTLADRAAALTTIVQEDVVHNIASLESMVMMVQKKDRRESMAAIGSLKDMFIELLPNKRKLRTFSQIPVESLQTLTGGNKDTQDRILALWYFESHLKKVYESFVQAVLAATFDTVAAHKLTALKVALDLLTYKPEQEQKLLAGLVNKLGDPDKKIAANTAHLLSCLVRKHPNMKPIVATEVENVLYRSNISKKAQYYAVCFLNQMLLSKRDRDLSVKLVTIYFSFFKASIKMNEIDSKLMSALLIGVVRAFPYAKGSEKLNLDDQISAIYKLVHTINKFTVSVQALMLLYQVCSSSDSMTDRYYTSLYAKILDPEIKNSSKQSMFLNLVFKSMRSDPSDRRCKAFIKRLLQICACQSPSFICAALITISEVVKNRPQVISLKSTPLVADDESDEEHFVDALSDSDDEDVKGADRASDASITGNSKGWTHTQQSKADTYDSLARNPLYCYADKSIETELTTLSRHYHPSVVVFANQLLESQSIAYKGDPITDFSLQKFLDRFVFRNPKKVAKQDKAEHALSSHKKLKEMDKSERVAVNTEQFYNMESARVPADQRFFHSYFHKLTEASKHKLGSRLGESDKDVESGDSDVDDDDFDSYLSKYEKSLYSDMSEDAFGADFASDFKKKRKSSEEGKRRKSAEGEESDESDSGLSDGDLDDDITSFDLKAADFGLDEDDLTEDVKVEKKSKSAQKTERSAEDSDDSDASSDLPLEMEGDIDRDFDSEDGGDDDMEGWFAPAPDQDLDEENVQFSDDEFSAMDFSNKSKTSKNRASKLSNKKYQRKPSGSLFAAADEFADLLDEESTDKRDTITSNAVTNRGKTDAKQLAWENKQEVWLSGGNRKRSHSKPGNAQRKGGGRQTKKSRQK